MIECEPRFMELEHKHFAALDKAERWMFHSDFCPYLELKSLLSDGSPEARARFRVLFTNFYGLRVGGLTDEFKDKFFEILHGDILVNGQPDFRGLLDQLSGIKRQKGDVAIPFSFVSKLVAMHHEASPIYDRHVLAFFQKKAPPSSVAKPKRIQEFVAFLEYVARSYEVWAKDSRVAELLDRLKRRDCQLANCHIVRLMDLLVWKVGKQRFLTN